MLKNYIKVAIRNIRKNKVYALLNIMGLSVGLASFFIIYLFLQNEYAYDQFHPKADRIYRVIQETTLGTGVETKGETTSALAPVAAEVIPEIEAFSRIAIWPKNIKVAGEADSTISVKTLAVEKGFLDFYGLEFLAGDAQTALDNPNAILINESRALQIFNTVDALGEVVNIDGVLLTITGVFRDLPHANSLKAEIVVPIFAVNAWRKDSFTQWNSGYGDQTYFLLSEGADLEKVATQITELYVANSGLDGRKFWLQPITDIHFSLDVADAIQEKSDSQYILIFSLVAVFILICSVFNYVSLALSQSVERVKEIGVRKVVGAKHSQLFWQFVIESIVYVLSSYVLALILVEVLTPELEALIGRQLSFDVWSYPGFLFKGLLFSVGVAVLSALYPAFFVTRLKAINILKKTVSGLSSHTLLRAISVFQIMVFMVLISVAFIANRQLQFLQNENLGFDKDQLMIMELYSPTVSKKQEALRNELLQVSSVSHISHAQSIPTRVTATNSFRGYDFRFHNFNVDEHFFATMGMELVEGRGFLPEDSQTKDLVIVNETAVKKLEFDGTAIGKIIKAGRRELRIIGVVKDFHFGSKKESIEATLFRPITVDYGMMVVKLKGDDLKQTMADIKTRYAQVTNDEKINFYFLDDAIDAQYKQENMMIKVINTFTSMAAFVAFIGLFGISGYAVKRRIKEMGIRKVLGAGFMDIQKSLNRSNLARLFLAVAIALPLIVYWMNSWLNSFAYRIDFPVKLVTLSFLMASVVIMLTISFHSIRAYLINPVEILKDE